MKIVSTLTLLALSGCGAPACTGLEEPAQVSGEAKRTPELAPGLRSSLVGQAAAAYDVLASTQRFTDAAISYNGETPREVIALRILSRDQSAAWIFRDLLEHGAIGTRLYALCGLYYAAPAEFEEGVAPLRGTTATIVYQTGCQILEGYPVARLVDAGRDSAVRLDSPSQTIREWKEGSEARFSLGYDIVGGGFPDLFRSGGGYGELREERLEGAND